MNTHALEQLELKTILAQLADKALTNQGKALIMAIEPIPDRERIYQLFREIEEAKAILYTSSSVPLQNLIGMDGLMKKLEKDQVLNPDDLTALSRMLRGIERLKSFMRDRTDIAPIIAGYAYSLYPLKELIESIEGAIAYGEVVDSATLNLSRIRKAQRIIKERIKTRLDSMVASAAYKPYLQETMVLTRNDRYVLAIKSEARSQVPGDVIAKSSTGSTLFIEPESIGRLQGELNGLQYEEDNEVYQILMTLTSMAKESYQMIHLNMEALVNYDLIFAKGSYANQIGGHSVKLNYEGIIDLKKARHPLLGKECVPLDLKMGPDYRGLIITGPNTGGKTVALKTLGLLTLLATCGILVPCDKDSQIALFSEILVDIGDGQSLSQNLSTFSSHITNIIRILKVANSYALVLLDELGSGTDPKEGEGLAIAILDQLYKQGATMVITSHYGMVKEYGETSPGFINGRMTFDLKSLQPKYQLIVGESGESNALVIALRLGMKASLIEEAHYRTYGKRKTYIADDHLSNPMQDYKKVAQPKAQRREAIKTKKEEIKESVFAVGDIVYVTSLKQRALVFEVANQKEEVGIKIRDKKFYVHQKRLRPFIDRSQLYPDLETYDLDIVTESKDYRKKDHQMGRKFRPDITIVHKEGRPESND